MRRELTEKTTAAPPLEARIRRSENRLAVAFDGGEIYFETIRGNARASLHDDFAVWALLPLAMHLDRDLGIMGSVHEETLKHAARFAYIWNIWAPEKFHSIAVSATQIRAGEDRITPQKGHGALLAFSGGLDSVHALLAYGENRDITHTLTVQGFDYDLNNRRVLEQLIEKTGEISRLAGAENLVIRTNLRDYMKKWSLSHTTALAAVLYTRHGLFSQLLSAHGGPPFHDPLMFPWGDNHYTNKLFSLPPGGVEFIDGDLERSEKLSHVMTRPDIAKHITVCWKDTSHAGNCGKCNKCLRTKVLARAVTGRARPIFDDDAISPAQVRKLIRNIRIGFATVKAERAANMLALRTAQKRNDSEMREILKKLIEAADKPAYGPIRKTLARLANKLL